MHPEMFRVLRRHGVLLLLIERLYATKATEVLLYPPTSNDPLAMFF